MNPHYNCPTFFVHVVNGFTYISYVQVNEKLSIYGKATHPAALAVHEILLKGPFPMLRDGVRVMDLPGTILESYHNKVNASVRRSE